MKNVERSAASENDQPIMAHHYEFSVAGRAFRATSYSSDQHAGSGDMVTIEYLKSNPLRSRVLGMRREMFGPGADQASDGAAARGRVPYSDR